jgi:KipI family sensor histidine kinase inhibitor
MQIDPLGDSAVIVRLPGVSAPGIEATDAVLAALSALRGAEIAGVDEVTPAYTTVAVFYNAARVTFTELKQQISAALATTLRRAEQQQERQTVEIPVCYDGEFAPDLADVARHTRLVPTEVVELHSSTEYRVGCVGFTPGFPYLVGLRPELATPRRQVPRREVAAGAVAIGGSQTGIYPTASPGGWNVIGRTPVCLFDVTRDEPALLRAGDAVRLRPITRAEFDAMIG